MFLGYFFFGQCRSLYRSCSSVALYCNGDADDGHDDGETFVGAYSFIAMIRYTNATLLLVSI